jgi:peptidoglycan/xylan/chitin deacetylase (PgdA/CDA1 family)
LFNPLKIVSMNVWNAVIPAAAATGLSAWGAFHPRSRLFGPAVSNAGNACALTFDDGPNPSATPRLLSLLETHGVTATFFVLGKYVDENPGLAAEIVSRKHVIGNHTYGHPNTLFFSRQRIADELNRCQDAILKATGLRSICVRPPFGFRGPQFYWAALTAGLSQVVMWSVSARDWTLQPWERVSRRIQNLRRGDILLCHDGDHRTSNADRNHTLRALEFWLPRWIDSGLEFTKF